MIVRSIALVGIWVALWGELSVANVASGLLVVTLIGVLFPAQTVVVGHRVHPWWVVVLAARLLVRLIVSSWAVARAVLVPRRGSRDTAVVEVPLTTRSPLVAALVANSITLTPGTMSIECDPSTFVLEVHVLGPLDKGAFVDDIRRLEQWVIAAVTPIGPSPTVRRRGAP